MVVGFAGWEWLAYLPSSLALFVLVPFAASLPARERARRTVAVLTSSAMLLTFFSVGWFASAGNGSRERLVSALPLLVPVYGVVALTGLWVAWCLRLALNAAVRRAA